MSKESRQAREAMRSKIARMIGNDPRGAPIDASGYTQPDGLNAYAQTGMRPVSKRQFERGGASKAEGAEGKMHAGRKPRKAGGKAMPPIDAMLNRDVKIADAYRDGGNEHVGGMKKGGRAHKMGGGPLNTAFMGGELMHRARGGAAHTDEAQDRVLIHKMIKPKALTGKAHGGEIHHKVCRCERCMGGKARSVSDGEMQGTRPTGDRLARKDGGRAKGKTNINIIIGAPRAGQGQDQGMPQMQPRPPMPMPMPMPQPGQAGMPMPVGMPMPAGMPPNPPPGIGRKSGGRAEYPIDAGAGGGRGRLEKIKQYGGG